MNKLDVTISRTTKHHVVIQSLKRLISILPIVLGELKILHVRMQQNLARSIYLFYVSVVLFLIDEVSLYLLTDVN